MSGSPLDAPLSRAARFVAQAGAPLEHTFCETLLRELPARALLSGLAARQEPDGGLAPWVAEDKSPEAATRRGLLYLDALGLMDHPVPEGAVAFLARCQAPDGGWGETSLPAELRIAITGESAGLLAKTPFARESLLARAEAFLARCYSPDLLQSGEYAPLLAYAHAFANVHSELADEALVWCGRELEKGFRGRRFSALQVARVMLRARARALPGAQLEAQEIAVSVLASQSRDGSFPGDPGQPLVSATLEAIEALLRLR